MKGGGYREALYEGLTASLKSILMVGPSDDHASPILVLAGQQYHAGFPGYRIDQLSANLDGDNPPWPGNYGGYWLTGIPDIKPPLYPDIILLMAGTNDLTQNNGVELATERFDEILNKLFTLRPSAHIIVAEIPPIFSRMEEVAAFNIKIKELALRYELAGYSISVVNQYAPFLTYPEHFADGVHPSDKLIYRLIGFQWLPKMEEIVQNEHCW